MPRNTTHYKIAGTKFFRLASTKMPSRKKDLAVGSNLQNVEKSLRVIYKPDDGKMLGQCDQSGADAFIMAYLLPVGNKLREMFLNKIKPHIYLGTVFTEHWEKQFPAVHILKDTPISKLKENFIWPEFSNAVAESDNNPPATRFYYHYKQTCHSSNYDIAAPSFRLNTLKKSGGKVVLTKEQSERYISGWHSLLPELRAYYYPNIQNLLKSTGMLYSIQGYPITFTGLINEAMFKEAYSAIPQCSVGIITHIAYTNLQLFIELSARNNNKPVGSIPAIVAQALDTYKTRKRDWDLLNNCHDSYLSQFPVGEEQECGAVMRLFMEQDMTSPRGESFRMRSEFQAGYNWSPAKTPPAGVDLADPKIINKYNLNGLKVI